MSSKNIRRPEEGVDVVRGLRQELRDALDMVALGHDDSLEVAEKGNWTRNRSRRRLKELESLELIDSEIPEEMACRRYFPIGDGEAVYELIDVDVEYVPDLDASGPEILTYIKNEGGEVGKNEMNYFVREMLREREGSPKELGSSTCKAAEVLDTLEEKEFVEYDIETDSYTYSSS